MPIYEYECKKCNTRFEYIKLQPQPDSTRQCEGCGAEAELAVSVPAMHPDDMWAGHMDPTLGYVTSRSELKRKEKRAGLAPADKGMASDARMIRASKEHKKDKLRREAVGETVREVMA